MFTRDLANYASNETQDTIITDRILNGEKELFALLITPHQRVLYDVISAMTKEDELIQGAMKASLVAALQQLYCFHGQHSFRIWFLSVAIHETRRLLKTQNASVSYIDGSVVQFDEWPEDTRLVFALHKLVRFSKREISICLQLPVRDVNQHLVALKGQRRVRPALPDTTGIFAYDHDLLFAEFIKQLKTQPSDIYSSRGNLTADINVHYYYQEKDVILPRLRQQHSENLVFCANVRSGFLKGVDTHRIKGYTDWYWRNHLKPHFSSEETAIFPILGKANPLIKKAISEHKRLQRLFESKNEIHRMLNRIEEELAAHIRFEERVLFREIERSAGKAAVEVIENLHELHGEKLAWQDQFWK